MDIRHLQLIGNSAGCITLKTKEKVSAGRIRPRIAGLGFSIERETARSVFFKRDRIRHVLIKGFCRKGCGGR